MKFADFSFTLMVFFFCLTLYLWGRFRSVRPEEVLYGGQVRGESEMKYKDQPGTRLRHTYEVVNDGPWHVNNLELHVEWPFQVANNKPLGKWLLYMDDEPAIEGKVRFLSLFNPVAAWKIDGC